MNWLMKLIFGTIGRKLDGYKMKIAGAIPFCMAVAGLIGLIFPDSREQYGLPNISFEEIGGYFTAAFMSWGIGGKLEKTKKALVSKDVDG